MIEPRDPVLVAWLDRQVQGEVWTTTVSAFEIRFGLSRLPEGRRRRALEDAFELVLRDDLAGRVAPLDYAAAIAAGTVAAQRRADGRVKDISDTFIAGIAVARRAVVVTRNVRHFDDLDSGTVDPWANQ